MHFKCYQISFSSTRKMSQMIIAQLYCFVFILLLAFGQSTSFKLTSYPVRRYVWIVNHLNNKALTYHCKSADDDLGLRTLQPNGEWEFSFKPALFKTTYLYCYFFFFFYENFSASFNVYIEDSSLEFKCGGDHCLWTVQEDGFYLYNTYLNTNTKMHDWKK